MLNRQTGYVSQVKDKRGELLLLEVELDKKMHTAYAFPALTGDVGPGDRVLLNTTAVDLDLGSGGCHFVLAVLDPEKQEDKGASLPGHIMKLRYTPLQMSVLAVEEPASPYHSLFLDEQLLQGVPVIGGSLHSMLIPAVCGLKAVNNKLKVVYVMTDGGALPISLSNAVSHLKRRALLEGTVTVGHGFGGDYEAVNLYSGILAAKKVFNAQAIIVIMGPGIVGTDTIWGNTALELGQIINAANTLEGMSFTIPRLSFADPRCRHRAISHHTLTALNRVALSSTCVVFPELNEEQRKAVHHQLQRGELNRHQLVWGRGNEGIRLAREEGLELKSMGRTYEEDPVFFSAASATGEMTAHWLKK